MTVSGLATSVPTGGGGGLGEGDRLGERDGFALVLITTIFVEGAVLGELDGLADVALGDGGLVDISTRSDELVSMTICTWLGVGLDVARLCAVVVGDMRFSAV